MKLDVPTLPSIPEIPKTQEASLMDLAAAVKPSGSAASQALMSQLNTDKVNFSPVATQFSSSVNDLINQATAFNAPGGNPFGNPVGALHKVLAAPSFVTGAKDNLAAVDVYGVTTNTPINSITATPDPKAVTSAESLKGSKSTLALLDEKINSAAKAVSSANKANPLVRINQASTLVASSLRSLPPGCSQNLLSKILSGLNKNSKLSAGVGGLMRRVRNSHLACITGMDNLISSLGGVTNSVNILDPAATISSLSGVVKAASGIGIPNTFGTVMKGVKDIATINQVATSALPDVVKNCDLGSLKDMSTMTSSGALLMANPNLVSDFSKYYVRPDGMGVAGDVQDYHAILDTYNTAHPGWNTCKRDTAAGPENVYDISRIMDGSPDFMHVMKKGAAVTNDQANTSLMFADALPKVSVSESLSSQFSGSAFGFNNPPPSSMAVDPITLNTQSFAGVAI